MVENIKIPVTRKSFDNEQVRSARDDNDTIIIQSTMQLGENTTIDVQYQPTMQFIHLMSGTYHPLSTIHQRPFQASFSTTMATTCFIYQRILITTFDHIQLGATISSRIHHCSSRSWWFLFLWAYIDSMKYGWQLIVTRLFCHYHWSSWSEDDNLCDFTKLKYAQFKFLKIFTHYH